MAVESKTTILGLPQWKGNEYLLREDMNTAFASIEDMLAEFGTIIDKDGYSYAMTEDDEDGTMEIVVTAGSGSGHIATLTAVIGENESGATTVDVTTVIDGVTKKASHTFGDTEGQGGPVNE